MQLPTAIEMVATASLVPYAKNARTHSQGQVAEIAASMREFGWTSPILINDRSGIIAGHGRILAAQRLAMDEVPCIRLGHLTAAQERALVIADNKLALNAGWDLDILKGELSGLMSDGFDMPIIGFSGSELADLFGGKSTAGSLAAEFMVPPFSTLNAREGWWQDRKRAWIALGMQSELGRGVDGAARLGLSDGDLKKAMIDGVGTKRANASPGGSPRPVADSGNRQRGNSAGKAI